MIETNLSMNDFTKYFEKNALGSLSFPNGESWDECSYGPFRINLRKLYKLVVDWKINHTGVPLDDIVGVIAFGSAVKYPGYKEVSKTRKEYFLFGKEITKTKQVPIQPNDADFLVITNQNFTREEILEPLIGASDYLGSYIKEGGIHLVNRGIKQIIKGVQAKDTVSISAMKEGVQIFYDRRLSDVQSHTGITRETPRKILWDENRKGNLIGKIE